MSCLFGITRIQPGAIHKLVNTRKNLSEKFYKGSIPASSQYPNDEIFVSTVGRRLGLRCAAIDKISSSNFLLLR